MSPVALYSVLTTTIWTNSPIRKLLMRCVTGSSGNFCQLFTPAKLPLIALIKHTNLLPHSSQWLIFRGFCLSSLRLVLLLSFWVALGCLCASACSGRVLLRLWMALCPSKLSPRLPRSSATALRKLSLSLISSLYGMFPLDRTQAAQTAVLFRQEPCEMCYLCNATMKQWESILLSRVTFVAR